MREIKFNFVYGIDGETDTYFTKSFDFGEIENGCHWDEIADSPLLREYAIVGKRQYTGLKDKNGVEIYEGDICKFGVHPNVRLGGELEEYIGSVVFESGCFWTTHLCCEGYPEQERLSYETLSSRVVFCGSNVEIIGNIYQNPELLKGGE